MKLNKKPYKGTRDFFPKDMQIREYIFGKMKEAAQEFGFLPYDGPSLEEVELYKAKSGEELINDQIYSFTDRGGRFVAIRPEMTPTLARMVAQVHREVPKPLKWYSIPNLMRYEKPQRGRLREHWQFNADVFGAEKNLGEIEILSLAISLMNKLGANENHFEILINDRRIVDQFFKNKLKLDSETQYKLYKVIDKAKKVKPEVLDKMVSELLDGEAKKSFNNYLKLSSFKELVGFIKEQNLSGEDVEDFLAFTQKTKALKLDQYLKYDPTIVRGLDYYTGTVFEIFDKNPENRRAICGGGAYANLLQIFNENPLPGIGFGLGDVTLRDFLETHKLLPDIPERSADLFFTYQDEACEQKAFELASVFRNMKIKVDLNLGVTKFKKVFKLAEQKGYQWIALMGSLELEKEVITLKNIKTQESQTISLNDLTEIKKQMQD